MRIQTFRYTGLTVLAAAAALALSITSPLAAGVVTARTFDVVMKSGKSFTASAVDVAQMPGPGPTFVPIPYPNINVTEVTPGTNTITNEVGVKKTGASGEPATITIDFSTVLLAEESASFKIALEGPGGRSLGSDFEVTVDSSSSGRVTFDLARLPVADAILNFSVTLHDSGSNAGSTFDISSVEMQGVTLTSLATTEPWSPALNIGAPINTSYQETGTALSRDARSIYFASNRPCGTDDAVLDFNLWVAHRAMPGAPWQEPTCLAINADARLAGELPYQDREPTLSRDQHWLYFVSDRPGSLGASVAAGGGDIWVSFRHNVRDDAGWTTPFRVIGPALNTGGAERTPHLFERSGAFPQLIFSSSRSGVTDLWAVDVLGGVAFGRARPLENLNTPDLFDAGGAVSRGGREIFIFRGNPPEGVPLDIYTATRPHAGMPWSAPVPLGAAVNSAVNDQEVALSARGTLLFFASARQGSVPGPTGAPSLDIWVAKRQLPSHDQDDQDDD
jgi:hypothetical protein